MIGPRGRIIVRVDQCQLERVNQYHSEKVDQHWPQMVDLCQPERVDHLLQLNLLHLLPRFDYLYSQGKDIIVEADQRLTHTGFSSLSHKRIFN